MEKGLISNLTFSKKNMSVIQMDEVMLLNNKVLFV